MPMSSLNCPVCDVACRLEHLGPRSPHYGVWRCPKCGKHRGWAPTPPEEYSAWKMPFGVHTGSTLTAIAQQPGGRSYLEWVAKNVSSARVREVVRGFLAQLRSQQTNSPEPGAFFTTGGSRRKPQKV